MTTIVPPVYYDEEDCLGLELFIAELELVVGNRRGKPDQVQLLELLPKLAARIPKTDRATLKLHQRKCEAAFKDLLLQGMSTPVARLISMCLNKLYTHGDIISIYSFVGDLQKTLSIKEAAFKGMAEAARPCVLDCLADLSLSHGRYLASAALESTTLARALLGRTASSNQVKASALKLLASVVEGLNPFDRSAAAAQSEAWAMFTKYCKDRMGEEIRIAALSIVSGMARAGCALLWNDGAYYFDQAVRLCSGSILEEGCAAAVCDAYALALADLSAAVQRDSFKVALRDERRPAKRAALEALAGRGAVAACLATPLVQAGALGRREACVSLAVAWTSYIGGIDADSARPAGAQPPAPPSAALAGSLTDELVELALQVVLLGDSASQASKVYGVGSHINADVVGSPLSSGEMPHLSACLLYILRAGVVEALAEAGQRVLLRKLVTIVSRPTTSPPAAVVALEGMSILLSALGEISDEAEVEPLERAIAAQLSSVSAAVRHQAAQALASLTMAIPASCSRLLASALAALEGASRHLGGFGPEHQTSTSSGGAEGPSMGLPAPVLPFIIPITSASSGGSEQQRIAHAHGCALAVSSLLVTVSRLPLCCSSVLWEQAVALASRLVQRPYSKSTKARALEREAGYLVIGALCRGGLVEGGQLEGRVGQLLGLMELALGEDARAALDLKTLEKPGGDMELAMQLWWRSVALQALATLLEVAVVGGQAGKKKTEQQISLVVDLLTPLLSTVESQPLLLDPAQSRGLLSSCVATFQMRLLRVYLILPGGWPLAQSQAHLLRVCLRPVAGAGPVWSAADDVHRTSLRLCLPKQDTALGPWPPGRDTAEDELRTFVGQAGGPHQQLWEANPFTALTRSSQLATRAPAAVATGARDQLSRGGNDSPGMASSMSLSPTPSFALSMPVLPQPLSNTIYRRPIAPLRPRTSRPGPERSRKAAREVKGCLYPQPLGLGPALLATQLSLLGRLLCRAPLAAQLQILEMLLKCASTNRGEVTNREQAARRQACCTCAAVAALTGLAPLLRRHSNRAPVDPSDKVSERVLSLANALLDDHSSEPALARAAAQLFAASAALGSEAWCLRLQRGLVTEVSSSAREGRDAGRRGALSLALGCLYRLRGGLTLQGALPSTTEALSLTASRPSRSGPPSVIWALHALTLVAESAGPAFLPDVRKTLSLCQELAVSGVETPGLQMACSRLANSLIAVLGPEFTLGSAAYRMARSLITGEMDAAGGALEMENDASMPASGTAAAAAASSTSISRSSSEFQQYVLQAVLLVQQLILFAPQAVRARRHVPLLRAALLSKRPSLRRAAAATLRHLAGCDAALLLPEGVEPALFAALDSETDVAVTEQLEATLEALMLAGAPTNPVRWRDLLSQVAFAAPASALPAGDESRGSGNAAGAGNQDDDDDMDVSPVVIPATSRVSNKGATNGTTATSSSAAATDSHSAATGSLPLPAVLSSWLRLRTRTFAAELLGKMVSNMSAETTDRGMAEQLQVLVDIGFRLATGAVEALKPAGVRMLQQVVLRFSSLEDPLLPGALLLEQYQAQLVSTLRAALQPGVHPLLAIAGGSLASVVLQSGVAAGDPQVMKRLMHLLTTPLADWQAFSYDQYAEWVTVCARVALLQAHAQCASIQVHGGNEVTVDIVIKAHKPYLSMLRSLWFALLQDHALLETQHPATLAAYASELFPSLGHRISASGEDSSAGISPAVAGAVRSAYSKAAPVVLQAWTESVPSAQMLEEGGYECQRFCRLLEVSLMMASKAGAEVEDQLRSGPQQKQQQGSELARACTRLTAALHALKRLLSPSVLTSTALWPHVAPACVDATQVLLSLATGGFAQLAWTAAKEVQETDTEAGDGIVPESTVPLMLHTLSAASQLSLQLCSGLPQERLKEELFPSKEMALLADGIAEADARHSPLALLLSEVLVALSSFVVPFMLSAPETPTSPSSTLAQPPAPVPVSPRGFLTPSTSEPDTFTPPLPLPLPLSGAASLQRDAIMTLIQQATVALLQRAPPSSLLSSSCAPALLGIGVRLMMTSAPGLQLAAAQGFVDSAAAALAERANDDADVSRSAMGRYGWRQHLTGSRTTRDGSEDGEEQALDSVAAAAVLLTEAACRIIAVPPTDSDTAGSTGTSSRLSALLAVAMSAIRHTQHPACQTGFAKAVQTHLIQVLMAALHPSVDPSHQSQVLEVLRMQLQETGQTGSSMSAGARPFALEAFVALGPTVATLTRRAIRQAMPDNDDGDSRECSITSVAVEGVKLLLVAASLPSPLQEGAMRLLVPLLVDAAAPEPPACQVPMLSELALRLVTSLPASPSAGTVFRTSVAALPLTLKTRLQAALRDSAAAAAAAPPSATTFMQMASIKRGMQVPNVVAPKLPTIQLKSSFALPLPVKKE